MKNYILISILGLLAVGCSTSLDQLRTENRQNLTGLNIGMSKEDVLTIMGDKTGGHRGTLGALVGGAVAGANAAEGYPSRAAGHHPSFNDDALTATNPYRTETISDGEKTLEVLYYYTDIKRNDGAITDDELTPLVFDNGRLIGWGWSFLETNIQKYEIRLR